ncbi:uncharacterized protein BXZ73DRAFT_82533 [Epithele typhae]|uniref:uncharacterized protein n=1 Tax=Epithele typhae TaxID=378194 RepID=UPI002007DB45|nr:uncharacterized protein BXZ73DRAFT_82533 [Epithele typhae]KAH9912064.1 hypothetical protein BXZ73DRAFT_82533 [Epithele typhae]
MVLRVAVCHAEALAAWTALYEVRASLEDTYRLGLRRRARRLVLRVPGPQDTEEVDVSRMRLRRPLADTRLAVLELVVGKERCAMGAALRGEFLEEWCCESVRELSLELEFDGTHERAVYDVVDTLAGLFLVVLLSTLRFKVYEKISVFVPLPEDCQRPVGTGVSVVGTSETGSVLAPSAGKLGARTLQKRASWGWDGTGGVRSGRRYERCTLGTYLGQGHIRLRPGDPARLG